MLAHGSKYGRSASRIKTQTARDEKRWKPNWTGVSLPSEELWCCVEICSRVRRCSGFRTDINFLRYRSLTAAVFQTAHCAFLSQMSVPDRALLFVTLTEVFLFLLLLLFKNIYIYQIKQEVKTTFY